MVFFAYLLIEFVGVSGVENAESAQGAAESRERNHACPDLLRARVGGHHVHCAVA